MLADGIDESRDHEWRLAIFVRTSHKHAANMLPWYFPKFRQPATTFVSSGSREEPIEELVTRTFGD